MEQRYSRRYSEEEKESHKKFCKSCSIYRYHVERNSRHWKQEYCQANLCYKLTKEPNRSSKHKEESLESLDTPYHIKNIKYLRREGNTIEEIASIYHVPVYIMQKFCFTKGINTVKRGTLTEWYKNRPKADKPFRRMFKYGGNQCLIDTTSGGEGLNIRPLDSFEAKDILLNARQEVMALTSSPLGSGLPHHWINPYSGR